jgi:hypothetical protein
MAHSKHPMQYSRFGVKRKFRQGDVKIFVQGGKLLEIPKILRINKSVTVKTPF